MQLPAPVSVATTSGSSLVRVAPFELYYQLYKERCMKGVTNPYLKEFAATGTGQNPQAGLSYNQHVETEEQAKEFASRTIAANKGGEFVIYKAIKVIKLPAPEVEVIDLNSK